jgi:hypothetical protein
VDAEHTQNDEAIMATEKRWVEMRGTLRGQDGESGCNVRALEVTLRGGMSTLPVDATLTNYSIQSTDKPRPDGDYKLSVNGEEIHLRRKNGFWISP